MNTLEQNFWRLFGNYEDLTRDQAAAIREGNFFALNDIDGKKKVILDELASLGASLGLHREHLALKNRLAALTATEQQNTLLMGEKLAKARRDSAELDTAAKRLRAIGHTYGRDARRGVLRAHV
jgi:hypothetical protein